jgi:beta-phosphoglucomutase-like phosphatase (HAD superfamily)
MNRINTILFDWDGTLMDTAAHSFAAFQKSFLDLGISVNLNHRSRGGIDAP